MLLWYVEITFKQFFIDHGIKILYFVKDIQEI